MAAFKRQCGGDSVASESGAILPFLLISVVHENMDFGSIIAEPIGWLC
ncbi:MAG: hypothetical protein OIF56_12800 [Cohaesibacter sp.]|nr:hypothetical protein [Cohaesibacter sp.]MCV6603456.1 hypothetical protein [Cohaesibacter sp.]